ncbi:hypothetical protein [Cardinium endosymbiont of Oedothorax gibbosus]|uniref:hypothetical protein n=1 Tax=Cardinium endosymbiont of Oedothorax gibbosus TaxID=931101 RepID=UPI0020255615|nr:hypothetical protein [Cardinium endosymbiont of Oedothorax gibbosus]
MGILVSKLACFCSSLGAYQPIYYTMQVRHIDGTVWAASIKMIGKFHMAKIWISIVSYYCVMALLHFL